MSWCLPDRASYRPTHPSARDGKEGGSSRHQPGMSAHSVNDHHTDHVECGAVGPPVDVTTWRRCRLLDAGFTTELADRIAADHTVDIHALLGLVDRGCPPELALRILAPVGSP